MHLNAFMNELNSYQIDQTLKVRVNDSILCITIICINKMNHMQLCMHHVLQLSRSFDEERESLARGEETTRGYLGCL